MGRVVHVAICPWGELSMGRAVHGAKCRWGELSVRRNVRGAKCPLGELSMGRTVRGTNCPCGELSWASCHGRVVVGRVLKGRVLMRRVVKEPVSEVLLVPLNPRHSVIWRTPEIQPVNYSPFPSTVCHFHHSFLLHLI
jgi:hypothetical protein